MGQEEHRVSALDRRQLLALSLDQRVRRIGKVRADQVHHGAVDENPSFRTGKGTPENLGR